MYVNRNNTDSLLTNLERVLEHNFPSAKTSRKEVRLLKVFFHCSTAFVHVGLNQLVLMQTMASFIFTCDFLNVLLFKLKDLHIKVYSCSFFYLVTVISLQEIVNLFCTFNNNN